MLTFLYLSVLSCTPDKNAPPTSDEQQDNEPSSDTADTAEPDDDIVEPPAEFWTMGPSLPECTPAIGDGTQVALSGIVLSMDGPIAGVVMYDSSTGVIDCVGECDVTEATVICTEGVISPGLIDGHNHMQYNALPPWQHGKIFQNRYQWQSDGDYWDYRAAYDGIENSYKCEIGKWAEIRTLVGGGTSVVGSSGGSCIAGMVRNLDENSVAHEIENYDMYYSSANVTSRFDAGDGARYTDDIQTGELQSVMNHVAEGINGSVQNEIEHMFNIGMAGPGMVFVHSTDASVKHLAQMVVEGTSILWSPRSNLDLYQQTTPADIALRMGIDVALGPDWTWSGSANPSRELTCATEYLLSRNSSLIDQNIWEMATTNAARTVGLDGVLGILEPGTLADIAVFSYSETPYKPILGADPRDVKLMIIDGVPLYGSTALMESFATNLCETVSACGEERTLCVRTINMDDGYADLQSTLETALSQEEMPAELDYAKQLFGVWMCEETRESCNIAEQTEDDLDGDGISDEDDSCLEAYNPLQGDYDDDNIGDACDPCPLVPNESNCEHNPADIDEDGIPNETDICPWKHNPQQLDSDNDQKGDACDLCPNYANPGEEGCLLSVTSIRNPNDPDHPPEGSQVILENLVVTGYRMDTGFYAQDPTATEYAGIFIYDPDGIPVVSGQIVTVQGTYEEYYGLTEIKNASITVTGTTDPIIPIEVTDPCSIGTNGSMAEPLEAMLVTVNNTTVTNDNPDDPNDYNEFEVNDCLRIDDLICQTSCYEEQPSVGTTFEKISGILNYSYSHHKVLPRTASDMQ